MSAAQKQSPPHMTVAEFLEWDSGDWSGRLWQLVDGVPVAMAPASPVHGAIQAELARLIGNHLAEIGSACRVLTAPGIVPRVEAAGNYRIPDLGVTCAPDISGHVLPDPVLLAEILSPSNVAETRANVWSYATLPSVAEILVLHSDRLKAELLRRQPDGTWPDGPEMVTGSGILELASIGFSVPLAAVYRTSGLAVGTADGL